MIMSQHWHGHWTEDTFKPRSLCNWQIPNWHPKWPDRHCGSTKVLVDDSGRFLPGVSKSKASPWGDFKGTWDLPTKITRRVAEQLSSPPQYKYDNWRAHVKKNSTECSNGEKKLNKKTNPLRR